MGLWKILLLCLITVSTCIGDENEERFGLSLAEAAALANSQATGLLSPAVPSSHPWLAQSKSQSACPPPILIRGPVRTIPIRVPVPGKNVMVPVPIPVSVTSPLDNIYIRGPSVSMPYPQQITIPGRQQQPLPPKYISVPDTRPLPSPYVTIPGPDRFLPVPLPYTHTKLYPAPAVIYIAPLCRNHPPLVPFVIPGDNCNIYICKVKYHYVYLESLRTSECANPLLRLRNAELLALFSHIRALNDASSADVGTDAFRSGLATDLSNAEAERKTSKSIDVRLDPDELNTQADAVANALANAWGGLSESSPQANALTNARFNSLSVLSGSSDGTDAMEDTRERSWSELSTLSVPESIVVRSGVNDSPGNNIDTSLASAEGVINARLGWPGSNGGVSGASANAVANSALSGIGGWPGSYGSGSSAAEAIANTGLIENDVWPGNYKGLPSTSANAVANAGSRNFGGWPVNYNAPSRYGGSLGTVANALAQATNNPYGRSSNARAQSQVNFRRQLGELGIYDQNADEEENLKNLTA